MLVRPFFFLLTILISAFKTDAAYYSQEEDRHYYPEFSFRAKAAKNPARTHLVQATLKDAAGVYQNKTRSEEFNIARTVMITVIQYTEKSFYKLYLYNLLCYTQHHGIDMVVYIVHHSLKDWEKEKKQYESMGVKVLPYPDELFWSLLYSKRTEIRRGPAGRADYESKTPSFSSHGALVMLVPVLEVLLSGYHCIFFDVDIALVLDPVPFLAKGQSDLVTMVEMRSCPDSYTKTYHNSSSTTFPHKARKVNNAIESINWYTAEPNTGIQYVRSNDASIAFYTRWLARIISVNVMNDQKSLLRDFPHAVHSTDCLYGSYSDAVAVRHQQKPPLGHHLTHKSPNAAGHLHRHVQGQTQSQHGSNRNRLRWAANYTTLVEEVYLENEKPQPIKFCFVSELLFQNGQTAFTCGVKPSFKDSWILEMYKNGLQSTDEGTRNNMAAAHNGKRQIIEPAPNTPRFPVTVHANFCDKKTHELTVRGLWLVTQDSIDAVFNSSTCRTFDPLTTMYGTRNWTQEYLQVKHKRDYMYETFVQPGKLIQSTNGKEIFYVNEQRHKQLIPDKDTFIATVGDNKWSDVRYLPQPIMDSVPTGDPIPSVKKAQKLASELPTDASVLPASNSPPPPLPPHVTSPTTNPPLSGKVSKVSAPHALLTAEAPPPPQRKNQPQQKQEEQLSEQHVQPPKKFDSIILAGMLMRSESAATVFFIDKRLHKRRVPNMTVFTRLFGQRTKDIVIVPDAVLGAIPLGEPLL